MFLSKIRVVPQIAGRKQMCILLFFLHRSVYVLLIEYLLICFIVSSSDPDFYSWLLCGFVDDGQR